MVADFPAFQILPEPLSTEHFDRNLKPEQLLGLETVAVTFPVKDQGGAAKSIFYPVFGSLTDHMPEGYPNLLPGQLAIKTDSAVGTSGSLALTKIDQKTVPAGVVVSMPKQTHDFAIIQTLTPEFFAVFDQAQQLLNPKP